MYDDKRRRFRILNQIIFDIKILFKLKKKRVVHFFNLMIKICGLLTWKYIRGPGGRRCYLQL